MYTFAVDSVSLAGEGFASHVFQEKMKSGASVSVGDCDYIAEQSSLCTVHSVYRGAVPSLF